MIQYYILLQVSIPQIETENQVFLSYQSHSLSLSVIVHPHTYKEGEGIYHCIAMCEREREGGGGEGWREGGERARNVYMYMVSILVYIWGPMISTYHLY